MKFGLYLCNYGAYANPENLKKISIAAEESNWDGIYLWDHINPSKQGVNVIDPWIALSIVAFNTNKIRLGTTVTPIPRRRPRKLARETVSIDHLSNGRFTLGVGIGSPPEDEFGYFGEPTNQKIRGEMLDEGLDILEGLWSGEPYKFKGEHYNISKPVKFLPKPIQQPRIPIWTAGFWNYTSYKAFRRAAKYDGCIPIIQKMKDKSRIDVYRDIKNYIEKYRDISDPFDLVLLLTYPNSKKLFQDTLNEFEGTATWWLQSGYNWQAKSIDVILENIRQGPPV
jgi:alkanesulfonate monooxygenase SsuD/methylene tetrahydromethanopterin reductase-like flavin-dependent oxidoreductase (luciferase family)